MRAFLEISAELESVRGAVEGALVRVGKRFDAELRSGLPAVARLVAHVERYRGKMLRPILAIAAGLAAAPSAGVPSDPPDDWASLVGEQHVIVAAVCEMIHMATLVHDDVLDDAQTRRRGPTVNRLNGNEAAVILGDYLIAGAYRLCSRCEDRSIPLHVSRVAMTMASGELLQLDRRGDLSLDEAAYTEIMERKTASLIAAACRMGALCSGADAAACDSLESFGRHVGIAFQIQDDILDLTGRETVVGKSVGRDLAEGKLTLPVIHHLAALPPTERGESLQLIERAREICGPVGSGRVQPATNGCHGSPPPTSNGDHPPRSAPPHSGEPSSAGSGIAAAEQLVRRLAMTDSIAYARRAAEAHVQKSKRGLGALPDSPPRRLLMTMADAAVARTF